MKKSQLFFSILWLIWRYVRSHRLWDYMERTKTPGGETSDRFVKDERVETVFVFGSREGINEETIQRAFPRARIGFQCSTHETGPFSIPATPHRLVAETVAYKKKEMVVFLNPWEAEYLRYAGKEGLLNFQPTKLLFLLDQMSNEWKQKIVIASYENDVIKPKGSYYRELSEPHMIPFRIKSEIKELLGLKTHKLVKVVPAPVA